MNTTVTAMDVKDTASGPDRSAGHRLYEIPSIDLDFRTIGTNSNATRQYRLKRTAWIVFGLPFCAAMGLFGMFGDTSREGAVMNVVLHAAGVLFLLATPLLGYQIFHFPPWRPGRSLKAYRIIGDDRAQVVNEYRGLIWVGAAFAIGSAVLTLVDVRFISGIVPGLGMAYFGLSRKPLVAVHADVDESVEDFLNQVDSLLPGEELTAAYRSFDPENPPPKGAHLIALSRDNVHAVFFDGANWTRFRRPIDELAGIGMCHSSGGANKSRFALDFVDGQSLCLPFSDDRTATDPRLFGAAIVRTMDLHVQDRGHLSPQRALADARSPASLTQADDWHRDIDVSESLVDHATRSAASSPVGDAPLPRRRLILDEQVADAAKQRPIRSNLRALDL